MNTNAFQKLEKIGEGTYGIVYKAKNKKTGQLVALKKIRPESENEGIPATTIREILILKSLKHQAIIDLIEVIHNDNKMYLVFEYVETDLKKLIDKYVTSGMQFSPTQVVRMLHQLCSAIAFCHSRNIFHRDIKPENILIDSAGNVKLADFGLGRTASIPLRRYTVEIVTLWYRPPEILLGCTYYDASVDVWSLGCIMAELYTLVPLFMGDSEIDQLYKIFSILGTPNPGVWRGVSELEKYRSDFPEYKRRSLHEFIHDKRLASLVTRMLAYDPMERISAEEALADEYFEGLPPLW